LLGSRIPLALHGLYKGAKNASDIIVAIGCADSGDYSVGAVMALMPGQTATNPAAPAYAAVDYADGLTSETSASGVSWGAVFAGGVTAASVSIILALFGAGLGLASISPWAGAGVTAGTFTVLAAIWLIIVQWVSAVFGGYMAGRLRARWVNVHTEEVFFRDTAHGFLAWAVGTLLVVAVIVRASGSAANTGTQAVATAAHNMNGTNYYVDLLFRQNANPAATAVPANGSVLGAAPVTPAATPGMGDAQMKAEAATILAEGLTTGGVPQTDQTYLAQLVSEHTGLAPADAQARVTDVLNQEQAAIVKAKQVTDASRKAASGLAIYTFISLLIGAFIASVAGAIGGRLRDTY